ncbi:toll/interleukin-1 receptor domain-containing protein [Falsiroseomonas sp. HC035]|uniref:toll/interleukin-1 receptor domain-containing protein n=1 Tax=Falsiroseomonas sp. HC035 TaxID=3390999 RepID=UPI003D31756D
MERPIIFVSYRREDSAGWVGRLVDDLSERFGAENVFQDINSMGPGVDFLDAIKETLHRADCALVIIGPAWVAAEAGARRLDDPGDVVRLETATALRRGMPIIPVLVGGARMPAPDQLPEEIRPLARRNAAELSDRRWPYDLDQLAQAIDRLPRQGAPPAGPGETAAPPATGGMGRPWGPGLATAGGLAAAALLVAALVWRPWELPPQLSPPTHDIAGSNRERGEASSALPVAPVAALVVFGADNSAAAARPEVDRAKQNGFPSATIYRRQGSYRSVIEFPTAQAANAALPQIRALSQTSRGAYVRQLLAWCPNGTREANGFTECP